MATWTISTLERNLSDGDWSSEPSNVQVICNAVFGE